MELLEICKQAKAIAPKIGILDTNTKNQALLAVADFLVKEQNSILDANKIDIENGKKNHMPEGLLDRLLLTEVRIAQMAEGLRQVAALDDPIGEVLGMKKRPNGLMIGQKRVPLGVVGIIYEARPNVTADAFALCFKTGNVVILKGGSDAIHSNIAIVAAIRKALANEKLSEQAISLIEDTSRETAAVFMKMNEYVDVLIPRGGAGLIKAVVNQATIPVIETGTGNCHIFVDETADFNMAIDIIMNAKTQRIGVCNACESLVIHEKIADTFLPELMKRLAEKNAGLGNFEDTLLVEVVQCADLFLLVHQSHRFSDQKLRLFHVVLKNVIHIFCGQGIDIICRRVMGHRVLNKSTQRTLCIQEIRDVQIHTDRSNDLSVFVENQAFIIGIDSIPQRFCHAFAFTQVGFREDITSLRECVFTVGRLYFDVANRIKPERYLYFHCVFSFQIHILC